RIASCCHKSGITSPMASPAFIEKTSRAPSARAICGFNTAAVAHPRKRSQLSVVSGRVFGCGNRYRPDTIDIVDFEFDLRKSESNKAKHGIDFIEAQKLWRSKHVLLGAKDALEKRYMVIGTIAREHWSAIISYRGARIRIIGRSTAAEIETYAKI